MHKYKNIEKICLLCGKSFMVEKYRLKANEGKFCSISCGSKYNIRKRYENGWVPPLIANNKDIKKHPRHGANNSNWKGGISKDYCRYRKIQKERYPLHDISRIAFHQALKRGVLYKKPCEICGEKAHGHHDDYWRPFDVRWLCPKHHREAHGGKH
jgi:hypothetical protein